MRLHFLTLRLTSLIVFPLISAAFLAIYLTDINLYEYFLQEDNWVNWLTFVFLLLAGLIALEIGIHIRLADGYYHWFYFVFGIVCLFGALEEVSWGQTVLELESPEFFLRNSDQREINLHNVLQQELGILTKHVTGLGMFLFGVVLPLIALYSPIFQMLTRFRIVVPPLFLVPGFSMAAVLMLDVPTGDEEELGEFFFALLLFLFMIYRLLKRSEETQLPLFLTRLETTGLSQSVIANRFLLGTITVLGFGIRFWQIGRQGLRLREAAYAFSAQGGPMQIIQYAWQHATLEPPAWSLLLFTWTKLFGYSEFALRFPAAVAGGFATLILWELLRFVRPKQLGLRTISALLFALSPLLVLYSQDASSHSIVTLFALLSIYISIRLANRPTVLWALILIGVNWLLLASHLYAATLIVAEGIFFAVCALRADDHSADSTRKFGVSILLSFLPVAVWLLLAPNFSNGLQVYRVAQNPNIDTWPERLDQLWHHFTVAVVDYAPDQNVYKYWMLSLLGLGIVGLLIADRSRSDDTNGLGNRTLMWLLFAVIVVPLLPAVFVLPGLPVGTLAFVVPGLLILISLGLVYLWRTVRLVGLVGLLISVAITVGGIGSYFAGYETFADYEDYADDAIDDYREMAHYLLQHALPGDGVLLVAPQQWFPAKVYMNERLAFYQIPDAKRYATPVVPEEIDDQIQAYLRDHPSLWLMLYDDKSVDPNSFTVKYLTAVSYSDTCMEWHGAELCRFVSPEFVTPDIKTPLDITYGGELALQMAELALPVPRLNEEAIVLVQLGWQTRAQPSTDYKVSLRLVAEGEAVVAQRDSFPIGPLLPPTTWATGGEKAGYMALRVPMDLPPAEYRIQLLVYDPETGLPVSMSVRHGGTKQPLTLGILRNNGGIELVAPDEVSVEQRR